MKSGSWIRSSGGATPKRSTGASAATRMGYHSALAPSCFVYHAGSGITKAEGLVGDGDRTVDAHQAIIDQRYPLYTSQLIAFAASSIIDGLRERGLRRIVLSAARQHGYRLDTSRLHQHAGDFEGVQFHIDPDGAPAVTADFEGFHVSFRRQGGRRPRDCGIDRRAAAPRSSDLRPGTSKPGDRGGSRTPSRSCSGRLTESASSDMSKVSDGVHAVGGPQGHRPVQMGSPFRRRCTKAAPLRA